LIKDNTALVRKDTRGLLANEAVWIIRVNAQPAVASNENMSGPLIKNIYPNPYNNVTAISYEIPNSSRVEVSVYDIGGQLVKTLFYGPVKAGDFYTSWNGKDRHGFDLSSGSYLIKLKADKGTDIKKVMLVR
jgi:flagellar hook assembly protein FlgD